MKPPRCRLCGTEHWQRDPHSFSADVPVNTARNVDTAVNKPGIVDRMWTAWWRWLVPPKTKEERRREYQRQWMREHRRGH
jgi:hypothetical protein